MPVFGDLIREMREEKGWSLVRFANESKVSATRLLAIEKMDEPKVFGSTLEKLATAFGMTVTQLRAAYHERRDKEAIPFTHAIGGKLSAEDEATAEEEAAALGVDLDTFFKGAFLHLIREWKERGPEWVRKAYGDERYNMLVELGDAVNAFPMEGLSKTPKVLAVAEVLDRLLADNWLLLFIRHRDKAKEGSPGITEREATLAALNAAAGEAGMDVNDFGRMLLLITRGVERGAERAGLSKSGSAAGGRRCGRGAGHSG